MTSNVGPSRNSARPGVTRVGRGRRTVRAVPDSVSRQANSVGIGRGHIRRLVVPFIVSNVIIITFCIAISLAALLFTSTTLVALPAAIAQSFLVTNAAVISGTGHTIAVVPLLPACCVWFLTAWTTYGLVKKRASVRDLWIISATATGIPLLLTLTAAAMLWDAAGVFAVAPPPFTAYLRVAVLHMTAVAFGMGPRLWKALARRYGIRELWGDAAGGACRILGLWTVSGLVCAVVMVAIHWRAIGHPLVTLGFAPNAAFAGAGILLGGDYRIGASSISLFSVETTALPPVQWMVGIPGSVHPAAPALIAVPLIVAVFALRRIPNLGLVASPFVAIGTLILIFLSSGNVGVYGYAGPTWWIVTGLAALYPAIIGIVGLLLTQRRKADEKNVDGEEWEEGSEETPAEDTEDNLAAVSNEDEDAEKDSAHEDEEDNDCGDEQPESPPDPDPAADAMPQNEGGSTGIRLGNSAASDAGSEEREV